MYIFENFFNKKFNESLPISASTWYQPDEEGNGTHRDPSGRETKWGKSWREGKPAGSPGGVGVFREDPGGYPYTTEFAHSFFFFNWSIVDL